MSGHRRTLRGLVLVLGLTASVGPALAGDPPHHTSWPEGAQSCKSCHKLHNSPSGAITIQEGNANLCLGCHNSITNPSFAFPWVTEQQAIPGSKGSSHRWDAPLTNAEHGALPPLLSSLVKRVPDGKVQCSTCHDQHTGATANRGRLHASFKIGLAQDPVGETGSAAKLTLEQPAAGANPRAYLVKILVGGGVGTASFQVSNDNGLSWFGWSGSQWEAGNANGRLTGSQVQLTDGANVKVTFTGTFTAGQQWRFYVSYPMLRIPNGEGQLCEDCHRERVMSDVETGADGVKVFSHPVNVTLGRSWDRTSAILDANGAVQVTAGADADSNPTNNLELDGAAKVRCMTCHNPHDADSNSLTEDAR